MVSTLAPERRPKLHDDSLEQRESRFIAPVLLEDRPLLPRAFHGKTIFFLYEHTAEMMPEVERSLKETLANRSFSRLNVFHEMSGGSPEVRASILRTVNTLLAVPEPAWEAVCNNLQNSPDLNDLRWIVRLVGILRRIGREHGVEIDFRMLDMADNDPRQAAIEKQNGIGAFTRMACSSKRELIANAENAGMDLVESILQRTNLAIRAGAAGMAIRNNAMAEQLREEIPLTSASDVNLIMIGAQHAPVRRAIDDRETLVCAIKDGLRPYLSESSGRVSAGRIYDRAEERAVAGKSLGQTFLKDSCLELGLWRFLDSEYPALKTRFLDPRDSALDDAGSVRTIAASILRTLARGRRDELFETAVNELRNGPEEATFLQALRRVWKNELQTMLSAGALAPRMKELLITSDKAGMNSARPLISNSIEP